MNRFAQLFGSMLVVGSLAAFGGCEDKTPAPVKPAGTAPTTDKPAGTAPATDKHDGHDHAPGDKHDHDDHAHGGGSDLGSVTIGGYALKISQEGAIEEGKDAGFEMALSGGAGKPTALRAWVGTEDAKGSVKAKAEAEPDGFHLHVEVPKPIPAGAKLWIEIEASNGQKTVGSIAVKR